MYEVLCTCITAPLEGLLVDKAKYSENVGHHLVRWVFEIRTTGEEDGNQNDEEDDRKSNEDRRHQRHSSGDPT